MKTVIYGLIVACVFLAGAISFKFVPGYKADWLSLYSFWVIVFILSVIRYEVYKVFKKIVEKK